LKLKGRVTASKGANTKLKWSSSNTKYATVTSSGKVTAKKGGKGKTVTITAQATDGSGKKKAVKIKIK
jgi:VCBS repeat-containing protein